MDSQAAKGKQNVVDLSTSDGEGELSKFVSSFASVLPPDLVRSLEIQVAGHLQKEDALNELNALATVKDATFSFQCVSCVNPSKVIVLEDGMVVSYGKEKHKQWMFSEINAGCQTFQYKRRMVSDEVSKLDLMWVSAYDCERKSLREIVRAVQDTLRNHGVQFVEFGDYYALTLRRRALMRKVNPVLVHLDRGKSVPENARKLYIKYKKQKRKEKRSEYLSEFLKTRCALIQKHATLYCPEFDLRRYRKLVTIISSKRRGDNKALLPICRIVHFLRFYMTRDPRA